MNAVLNALTGKAAGKAQPKPAAALTIEQQYEQGLQRRAAIFQMLDAESASGHSVSPRRKLLSVQSEAIGSLVRRLRFQVIVGKLLAQVRALGPVAQEAIEACQRQHEAAEKELAAVRAALQKQEPRLAQLQQRMQAVADAQQAEEAAASEELTSATVDGDEARINAAAQHLEAVMARRDQGGPATHSLSVQHAALADAIEQLRADLKDAEHAASAAAAELQAARHEVLALRVDEAMLHAAAALYQMAEAGGDMRVVPKETWAQVGSSRLLRERENQCCKDFNRDSWDVSLNGSMGFHRIQSDAEALAQDPMQLSATNPQ